MEARMSVINPNACGIDVGSKMHYVATGQGSEEVKSFGVYTKDHQEMVAYLKSKGVKIIVMESPSLARFCKPCLALKIACLTRK